MSFSEANPNFGLNSGEVEKESLLKDIRRNLASTFNDYAATEAVVLQSQDEFGPVTEIVMCGLVPSSSKTGDYIDITLAKRIAQGRETISLAVKDLEYEISDDGVMITSEPIRPVEDKDLKQINFWLTRGPTVAIWSIDYATTQAKKWCQSQQRLQND